MSSPSVSTRSCSVPTQSPSPRHASGGHIDVYVVDDHPAVQEAIRGALTAEIDLNICGTAPSVAKALQEIKQLDPDVVIVDLLLKGGHGLDLVETVRAECPETKPIVYSMYDERIYAERAVRAGAAGYLMKNEPTERLVEAVRQVDDGELYLSRQMTSIVLGNYAVAQASEPSFPIDELTEAELQVFRRLGLGHSLEDIQEQMDLARKTVETYRRRAKEKLGLDSVDQLLQHAVLWALRQWDEETLSSAKNGTAPARSQPKNGTPNTDASESSEDKRTVVA